MTLLSNIRFEVFTAVTMKNAVLWDVAPCRYCVNRRFGKTYCLHLLGRKIRGRGTSLSRWLQTATADFSTQKMEAICSSETSVHTRSTRHHIPEDGMLLLSDASRPDTYLQFICRYSACIYTTNTKSKFSINMP
jgi:hypothetical protein